MSLLILVVDDEPYVEAVFRQQFRRDIRDGRFTTDFAQSADSALKLISDAAGASLILILSRTAVIMCFIRSPRRRGRVE
jgi:CheY-like chemotaxis protein